MISGNANKFLTELQNESRSATGHTSIFHADMPEKGTRNPQRVIRHNVRDFASILWQFPRGAFAFRHRNASSLYEPGPALITANTASHASIAPRPISRTRNAS
jgi:hypothetical protein